MPDPSLTSCVRSLLPVYTVSIVIAIIINGAYFMGLLQGQKEGVSVWG